MRAEIKKAASACEYPSPERCHISEVANDAGDEQVSIARARVEPGVTTAWHLLEGTSERYLVIDGHGRVELGDSVPVDVVAGDVVRIPEGTPQRITNPGTRDLIFFAICTPPFRPGCYRSLE